MRRLLLCPPDYYGIEYEINPWMRQTQNAEPELARAQWKSLHDTLQSLGCQIDLLAPQPGLPDLVFTANAGLVIGRRFILSNFRHKERRGEEVHFERWFAEHDFEVVKLHSKLMFEGEGDALFCGAVKTIAFDLVQLVGADAITRNVVGGQGNAALAELHPAERRQQRV